jgi:hypothetical protein
MEAPFLMSRAKTNPGTPNGLRAGTASIPAPVADPVQLRNHWLIRHGAKAVLVIMTAGLFAGASWVVFDARDALRDHDRALSQIKPIRDRVKAVEAAVPVTAEVPSLRDRVEKLERVDVEIKTNVRWIQRSLMRIERASGSRPEPLPRATP